MQLSADVVFRKTEKGQHELRHRSHGLSPRARQLLILADGRRRYADLAKMLPEPQLLACLAVLEDGGFVARLDDGAAAPAPAPPSADTQSLPQARRRVARVLLDAVGPSGDDLAMRLERCASIDELRALLPAAASIVEAVRGRDASERFVRQVGEP